MAFTRRAGEAGVSNTWYNRKWGMGMEILSLIFFMIALTCASYGLNKMMFHKFNWNSWFSGYICGVVMYAYTLTF